MLHSFKCSSMSNVCALALVVTATSPASGGGYYSARAQLDRSLGPSTSWPPRSMRQHGYAARHPDAAADKRFNEQLPWSPLAVSHPPARPCHTCAALCIAASLLTSTVPLPAATPTLPHTYSLSSSSPTPRPIAYASRVLSMFGTRGIDVSQPCPVRRSPLDPPMTAPRTPAPTWPPWHSHNRPLYYCPTPFGHARPSSPTVRPLVQHMHRDPSPAYGETTTPDCPGDSDAMPGPGYVSPDLGHVSPGLGMCRVRSYVAVSISADGRPWRPGWANSNILSRTAARMVTAVHAPSIASADLYHVHSCFIIPVNDDGWAWRPWTPLGRILSHTVERIVTTAHVPSLPIRRDGSDGTVARTLAHLRLRPPAEVCLRMPACTPGIWIAEVGPGGTTVYTLACLILMWCTVCIRPRSTLRRMRLYSVPRRARPGEHALRLRRVRTSHAQALRLASETYDPAYATPTAAPNYRPAYSPPTYLPPTVPASSHPRGHRTTTRRTTYRGSVYQDRHPQTPRYGRTCVPPWDGPPRRIPPPRAAQRTDTRTHADTRTPTDTRTYTDTRTHPGTPATNRWNSTSECEYRACPSRT